MVVSHLSLDQVPRMFRIETCLVCVQCGFEALIENLLKVLGLPVGRHSDANLHDEDHDEQEEEGADHARALLNRTATTEEGDDEHHRTHNDQEDRAHCNRIVWKRRD